MLDDYLPNAVNTGPWITAYTLFHLRQLPPETKFVLPICSLNEPYAELRRLGDRLLPPLFHEALDPSLKDELLERILTCFPIYGDRSGNEQRVSVVELPERTLEPESTDGVLAFSVDTAVEEHGPHLPLATDTIQSYGVLKQVRQRERRLNLFRPVEYGQLTWGLPFGFSVDLTVPLLTRYLAGFARAVQAWRRPQGIYVVDVHGSITHREAIVAGLREAELSNWSFRWLHEPLAEFASARGDQHAGGVETACVEYLNPGLLDKAWWPDRLEQIAEQQMSFEKAVELTPDLNAFREHVQAHSFNGVIGDIRNYERLDSEQLMLRMVTLAEQDVQRLLAGEGSADQSAGQSLW